MSKVKYKEEIESLIESWIPLLGLSDWRITIRWKKSLKENRIAQIFPQPEYKVATLHLSQNELRSAGLLEREDTVVHELAHCIEEPLMESQKDDVLERVTTDVARSLIRARDAGMEACVGAD